MTLKFHKRADYDPCEHEPCPCGSLFTETIIKRKGKNKEPQIIMEPIKDVMVRAHDAHVLIMCSTRTPAQIHELIDRRWTLVDDETCPDHCLGTNIHHSRHFTYRLRKKATFQLRTVLHHGEQQSNNRAA